MFAGLILFLLVGFPVAFSLGACGLFFAFVGIELGVLPEALLQALPLRIFGIMQNETMLAIPFFTLMGLILERSGMAEDLLETVGQLFGPVRGGVAFAVIFVGALLAATTGVVAASVITRAWCRRQGDAAMGCLRQLHLHGQQDPQVTERACACGPGAGQYAAPFTEPVDHLRAARGLDGGLWGALRGHPQRDLVWRWKAVRLLGAQCHGRL